MQLYSWPSDSELGQSGHQALRLRHTKRMVKEAERKREEGGGEKMNSEIVTAAPPTNPMGVIIFAYNEELEAHHACIGLK